MSSSCEDAKRPIRSIPPNHRLMPRSSASSTPGTSAESIAMQLAEVVGTVVATQKNRKLEGAKLLLVQPVTLEGEQRGTALLAIDAVGAGVGERVLVVIEGKAAGDALGRKAAAVDAAIIGIFDHLDVT